MSNTFFQGGSEKIRVTGLLVSGKIQ